MLALKDVRIQCYCCENTCESTGRAINNSPHTASLAWGGGVWSSGWNRVISEDAFIDSA